MFVAAQMIIAWGYNAMCVTCGAPCAGVAVQKGTTLHYCCDATLSHKPLICTQPQHPLSAPPPCSILSKGVSLFNSHGGFHKRKTSNSMFGRFMVFVRKYVCSSFLHCVFVTV
jgi:hypothetical protein